ncbi:hypothetical protein EPO15_07400 [bacterium]|nr:MAG: hypothetical protein EPO15_07400 [bacterium]
MLRFNLRRTVSMTLGAAERAAGDARAWLEDDGPAGYEAHKAAVERNLGEVGNRVVARLSALIP